MFESALIRMLVPGGSRRFRQVLALASATVLFLELIEPVGLLEDPGVYQSRQMSAPIANRRSTPTVASPLAAPEPILAQIKFRQIPPTTSSPRISGPSENKTKTRIVATPEPESETFPPVSPDSNLQLKGIVGWPNRPMALINNQAMAPGDAWVVENANTVQVKVRCLEIRKDRVILALEESDGETERCMLSFNDPLIRTN